MNILYIIKVSNSAYLSISKNIKAIKIVNLIKNYHMKIKIGNKYNNILMK